MRAREGTGWTWWVGWGVRDGVVICWIRAFQSVFSESSGARSASGWVSAALELSGVLGVWIPASAGMTGEGAGITGIESGCTAAVSG